MSHEFSNIEKLEGEEAFIERAREIFQRLQAIDPAKVHCMMGLVVAESSDNKGENAIHAFVLGSDEEIAKMFASLVTITRNGIMQANTPSTHNDEVKH